MSTKADEILEQVKGDDVTLTDRVDDLEHGQHEMKIAIADNTVITKAIASDTEDLVSMTKFARTGIKALLWLGGVAGALGSIFGAIYAYGLMTGGTGL